MSWGSPVFNTVEGIDGSVGRARRKGRGGGGAVYRPMGSCYSGGVADGVTSAITGHQTSCPLGESQANHPQK